MRTEEAFNKTYALLKEYLDTIAVINHISTDVVVARKLADGVEKEITNKTHTYFGVYNGSTKPVDRETLGVLTYPISVLEDELKTNPSNFTHDIILYMNKYGDQLKAFAEKIKQ